MQPPAKPTKIFQAVVLAAEKAEVGMFGGKPDATVGLPGAEDRNVAPWLGIRFAIVHREEVALVVDAFVTPERAQDIQVLGGVFVATLEIFVSAPQAHLRIFELAPATDNVDAKTSLADVVNGRGHFRDHRRMHGWNGDGGVKLDARRHGGQAGHQIERLQ